MPDPGPSSPADAQRAALDQLLRPTRAEFLRDLGGRFAQPRWRAIAIGVVLVAAVAAWLVFGRSVSPAAVDLPRATPGRDADASAVTGALEGGATTGPRPAPAATGAGGTAGAGQSTVQDAADLVVDVVGAVVHPGLVTVQGGGRVADAVAAAGGGRPDADLDQVNLAQPLQDGVRVVIPTVGQLPATPEVGVAGGPGAGTSSSGAPTPGAPLDLNSATAEELDALPGVGPATAKAIIDHRMKNGPYRTVDDLLDVRGIGPAKLDALRDVVTVRGS